MYFCVVLCIFVLFFVFLYCSMYFCVVVCIVWFLSFSVLFVCICVLTYCHRVATKLQLNISYHISYLIIYIRSYMWLVRSLHHNEFSRQGGLVLTISNCSILFALRSSKSCLHLIPRLPIPSSFPSVTCFRRRFLCEIDQLTFKSLAVSLRTTRFNIQNFYMVLALLCTSLTDWFL
jgi:hypothetical protein